jgi:hypothetical protein
MSDDSSALTGFLFYAFIVHPATAWILRPGRFDRKKSIIYAIGFLAALAAIKTGMEYMEKGTNHYQLLGVNRSSNPLEIKRAYKKLSLQLHPDKNPSPTASDDFDEVKQAYDVIMDLEDRDVYNKFGQEGVNNKKRFDETTFLLETGIFYATYGMLAYVLTLGKKSGDARNWIFTGLIVMLICEIVVMTSQKNPLPDWLFPTTTEHELVWFLHSIYPAFMNGCRSIGAYLYVDLDAQARALLLALQEQNKDILLVLRDVQINTQNLQAAGGGPARVGHPSASGAVVSGGTVVVPRMTPTGKIKELQDRLQQSNAHVHQAVTQLKNDGSKSSSWGFYAMIIGYVAMSYMFSGNSK